MKKILQFLIIDLIILTDKTMTSGETNNSAEGATTPETLRQKDRLKHDTLERD